MADDQGGQSSHADRADKRFFFVVALLAAALAYWGKSVDGNSEKILENQRKLQQSYMDEIKELREELDLHVEWSRAKESAMNSRQTRIEEKIAANDELKRK